jgi:uncharacterized membrane protein YGL010W
VLGGKPRDERIARCAGSHQHPANRLRHTFGIPLIALSIPLFVACPFVTGLRGLPAAMFAVG